MKPAKEISRLEPSRWKLFFSYLGWFLGLVGTFVTIYSGFVQKTEPKLEYDILSETDFYNDSETASYIKIFIDSLDVQENHLNISTYRIRVENKGNANIGFYDYDMSQFGLQIKNGKVLEAPVLLESSSDYIRSKFLSADTLVSTAFINIPKLVIDANDYYILKLVILHEAKERPIFIPEGKIVGQKEIVVNQKQDSQVGFWAIVFSGGFLVQTVRFVLFLLLTIVTICIIALIYSGYEKLNKKLSVKRIVRRISQDDRFSKVVLDDFKNERYEKILFAYKSFRDSESRLTDSYRLTKDVVERKMFSGGDSVRMLEYYIEDYENYQIAIKDGYFLDDCGNLKFNTEIKESVEKLVRLMKENGFFYTDTLMLRS